jgi:uncharacterized protein (TIGR02996 family)
MSEREAFFAAMEQRPDDDLPRLVYADWLDDQGESAHAELIRKQCALAKLPDSALEQILAPYQDSESFSHQQLVLPRLPAGMSYGNDYHRGFPQTLICENVDAFPELQANLPIFLPTTTLRIDSPQYDTEVQVYRAIRLPMFSRFRTLEISRYFYPNLIRHLDEHRHQIEELRFHHYAWSWRTLEEVVRSGLMQQITGLSFQGNLLPDNDTLDYYPLQAVNSVGQFRHLTINTPAVNLAWLLYQLPAGLGPTLECLDFRGRMTDSYSLYLPRQTILPELRSLTIDHDDAENSGQLPYGLELPFMPKLQKLRLRYFPDQVLPNLIQLSLHPEIRNLISLDLSYSSLPERWITAILDSPILIQLKEFKLINCWLTDYTGLALANSPYLQELAVLDLRGNLFSRAIEHVLRDRFAGVLLLMENP